MARKEKIKFRYTEPVAIVLLFVTLILHCLGYNSIVDSILMSLVAIYFGIDLTIKQRK